MRGPQVMRGYLGKPAETAQALAGGHLHTGDVAYQDADGYVFIVDRIKDVILTGGFNVYPRNVEEAIYLHPAVEECVVAGVPDAYRGQAVKAWIKLAPGSQLSRDELRAFLEDKLSHVEMPRLVEFRDQPLPKTMIGKLSRKDLLAEEAAWRPPERRHDGRRDRRLCPLAVPAGPQGQPRPRPAGRARGAGGRRR